MEFFMTHVALAAGQDDLKIAFANVLHKPPFPLNPVLNFDVVIFSRYDPRRGKVGILTLPTIEAGTIFMNAYGSSGITVKGRPVSFQPSRKAINEAKVAILNSTPWVDPLERQKEKERLVMEGRPHVLTQFAFGRFLADGKFISECTAGGDAEVACDLERRQVRLTLRKQQRHSQSDDDFISLLGMQFAIDPIEESTTVSYSPQSIGAILEARDGDSPVIFFSANTSPVYKSERTGGFLAGDRASVSRIQGLIHNRRMPPGCFSLMCTFKNDSDREAFVYACRTRLRIRHTLHDTISVIQGDGTYDEDSLERLLVRLPFEVAFELEKAVNNRIMSINGALSLEVTLQELSQTSPDHVASILRKFVTHLEEGGQNRKQHRRKRRRQRASEDRSLAGRFKHTIAEYFEEQQKPKKRLAPSNTTGSYTYQLVLTPTRHILEGPTVDQSNSVLRKFGNHECFLRVSFQDENGSKLRGDFETSINELLVERYRPILLNGCRVAGRKYQLLGYSMSGLREHSMWFVTPFKDAKGKEWDAEAIRNSLGDFSELQHYPARLGARWSQAFSATDPSITVQPDEIKRIDDRRSPSGLVMTDGCSPISTELMRAIWKAYRPMKKHSTRNNRPCALQFRLGGSKGMVVEDDTLIGKVVCLRFSQTKFEAPDNRTFDIQATSLQPKAMYLNRPLITLLEFLGADCAHITKLQDAAINEAYSLHSSMGDASKVLQQHGLGASFNIPSLLSGMMKVLGIDFALGDGQMGYCSDLLTNSLKCAETHILRELKYRAHITVPGSFTLYGVSDEWDCLNEGEIYATVVDPRKGIYEEIEGVIAITRSPQIHPGDVQLVKAVRREELKHLTNVVVFSCKGNRPLASCLGGGDLDGDDFNLILDPDLHPKKIWEPGAYESLGNKKTDHPCDIADVVDFIFDYIKSDLVGQIAIMHLRYADINDPGCKECLQLAEHASHAVDFPKTGTPVRFQDIPRLKKQPKPDFLSHEGRDPTGDNFYNSQKLLGKLFRRIPLEQWVPEEWNRSSSPSNGEVIENALRGVGLYGLGLPELQPPSEELCEEMQYLLEEYCDQLTSIGKVHTLSKSKDAPVSEAELVSGTLMANWSDHHRRKEVVTAMNMQTHELVRAVRAEMRTIEVDHEHNEDDEDIRDDYDYDEEDFYRENRMIAEHFKRAWAAWYVAEEVLREYPGSYGPQSFGFIALGRMLELIKEAKRLL
ncbi:RdRP-domain-containing protein [Scleroderma citrinum]